MVDEERVRLMTKLAFFEKREENKSLKITKYYRTDYVGLALLKNFFAATIAYVFVFAAVCAIDMTDIMDTLNRLQFQPLIVNTVIGYIVFLLIYSLLTYVIASVRYKKSKARTEEYEKTLETLEKSYDRKHRTTGTPADQDASLHADMAHDRQGTESGTKRTGGSRA